MKAPLPRGTRSAQPGGHLGGALDAAGDDGADAAVLQDHQAGDGAAGGGGDLVLEGGGMAAGLQHHGGSPQGHLGGQLHGHGPG